MKRCYQCDEHKDFEFFYKDSSRKDGHSNICKICAVARDAEKRNIERLSRPPKPQPIQRPPDYKKQQEKKWNAAWVAKFPEKQKAHILLRKALREKVIEKTVCIVCGNEKVEGHHTSYDMPIDVVWLCRPHHRQAHSVSV